MTKKDVSARRTDDILGGFTFTVNRVVFLVAATVLVFGTIGASWREVDTPGDLVVAIPSTLTAIVAQLAAIVGGVVGRPSEGWARAVVLSLCALLSALVAAFVVI
ncbi:hypothetical protein CLV49_0655 [Labedella gwakjiensis]|uniref:Uncharacterized protein n=1 Tax=Labedella gwakjiensis TaxID=390269 RepID=A0A2P8GSV6_9MICO|nr:hypothetical protein [Labedella gwakjiensis]PSL37049.1 hypothetical protein CLV49_0655 [Labedella gwakjiensis]RUQ82040.1 hypothetical protein ELQ93_17325 [Labedella gwakjiensis]